MESTVHSQDRFPGLRSAAGVASLREVRVEEGMRISVQWKRERPEWAALGRLPGE